MKISEEQIKRFKKFNFRYITHVSRDLYEIINAKKFTKENNVDGEPEILSDGVAFWHDGCVDHRCVIRFKDILME